MAQVSSLCRQCTVIVPASPVLGLSKQKRVLQGQTVRWLYAKPQDEPADSFAESCFWRIAICLRSKIHWLFHVLLCLNRGKSPYKSQRNTLQNSSPTILLLNNIHWSRQRKDFRVLSLPAWSSWKVTWHAPVCQLIPQIPWETLLVISIIKEWCTSGNYARLIRALELLFPFATDYVAFHVYLHVIQCKSHL